MGYVADDGVFSDSDDDVMSSSTVVDCLEDDDEVAEQAIDDDILANLSQPAAVKPLENEAGVHEKPMVAGIHVWSGVKSALEYAFEGWPDSHEYQQFRKTVQSELAKEKKLPYRQRDPERFRIDISCLPIVDKHLKMFFASPGNPLAPLAKKHRYYTSVLKIMARGVKYLTAETRQKYQVTLGAQLTRRGQPFCTETLCNQKKNSVKGSQHASSIQGKTKRCIWVMTEGDDGAVNCYSHFGKLGAFHHSSFTAGSGVMAAGEWYVELGKCTLINALSGHYKPEPWRFLRALRVLAKDGAIHPDTEVQLFSNVFPDTGKEKRLNAQQVLGDWEGTIRENNLYPP